jgi:hypothetical protein
MIFHLVLLSMRQKGKSFAGLVNRYLLYQIEIALTCIFCAARASLPILVHSPPGPIMDVMPFTLSHVAAAIPFQRTRLIPSALVIGCMVPDFEYFLRFSPRGGFGHTLPGVFVLDLPMALIALWLYHAYAKEPLYSWLPESVRRRIQLGPARVPMRNLAQFAMVLLSILVGIATHILWDSFTHPKFWPYRHWQFLHRTVQLPLLGKMEYVRVIQQVSTVVGALVLLLWFLHWYRKTAPTQPEMARYSQKNRRAALLVVCLVALAAAVFRALQVLSFGGPLHRESGKFAFESAVITAIGVFCIGVVLYGILTARPRDELQDA